VNCQRSKPNTMRTLSTLDNTVSRLENQLRALAVPTGTIWSFAGETAPDGWSLCDGRPMNRTEPLFQTVLVKYGVGDGVTTFNLPDFRGKFLLGCQNPTEVGTVGGSNNIRLQVQNLPSHNHTGATLEGNPLSYQVCRSGDCVGKFYIGGYGEGANNGSHGMHDRTNHFSADTNYPGSHHTHSIPSDGGDVPYPWKPSHVQVNYIIKL